MGTMKLLVVEDELRMMALLRRGLREEGYAVDSATNGQEAIWLAEGQEYAAILLDVMLPGIDGFTVCRRLRDGGCWTPVLMLTARTALDDRVAGLDAGADDYLVKPFRFAELAARVRALTRRGGSPRPVALELGDLSLDPVTHQAWRGGEELVLSPKEFALLELFLRHKGEVLSRSKILEQVWDFAYAGTSNVVDQYVAYLRRKIDQPFGRADLQTVKGVGYRLSVAKSPPA
jgi:two-component system OmpR family response regulator